MGLYCLNGIGRLFPIILSELEEKIMKKSISIFTVTLFTIGVIAIFIAGFSGTANALASSSIWTNSKLAKEDGMREARGALTNGKFTDIALANGTVVGNRGAYTALIRIVPEKQLVFIVVMGPDSQDCSKLANYLKANGIW